MSFLRGCEKKKNLLNLQTSLQMKRLLRLDDAKTLRNSPKAISSSAIAGPFSPLLCSFYFDGVSMTMNSMWEQLRHGIYKDIKCNLSPKKVNKKSCFASVS